MQLPPTISFERVNKVGVFCELKIMGLSKQQLLFVVLLCSHKILKCVIFGISTGCLLADSILLSYFGICISSKDLKTVLTATMNRFLIILWKIFSHFSVQPKLTFFFHNHELKMKVDIIFIHDKHLKTLSSRPSQNTHCMLHNL